MRRFILAVVFMVLALDSGVSQWSETGSYVFLTTSGDRVGIGTSTPATKFHVLGTGTGNSIARLRVESSDNQAGISFLSDGTGEVLLYSPNETDDFRISTGGSDRMIITDDGDFAFGTSFNATANFAVGGKRLVFAGSGLYGSYGTNDFALEMRSIADSWVWLQGGFSGGQTFQSLKLGVSVSSGFTGIYSDRDASGSESYLPLAIFTGGSERMRILTNGDVGIGTTTPASKLSVNGDARASDFILDATGESVSDLSKLKVKSLTISNPGTSENLLCFKMEQMNVEITKITAVLQGSSSPSIHWNVNHATDRSTSGPSVLIGGGRTTTNTTTGDVIDDFSGGDATVASNEFVWITTTSADYAGIVTALHLIIEYRIGS